MWHSFDKEELIQKLRSNQTYGLSSVEAENRIAIHGNNVIKRASGRSPIVMFLLQFHNPLIYILLISATIALFLGKFTDFSVIAGVVLINSVIGYIQESKATEAIKALDNMMVAQATVIRDSKKQKINAADVTIGDIVVLSSGDKVPCDIRLLSVNELKVDESILTGESTPAIKQDCTLPASTAVADRTNTAFAGTLVVYGQGVGVATEIGDDTEIGKIAELLRETEKIETPLLKKIGELGRLILIFVTFLSILAMVVGMARGESFSDMLTAAVALAVGAIPEGLPAAITIMLAIGVGAMAAKNAIIRTLPSVETLGSVTVICSDKTGTLTKNEMTVQKAYCAGEYYDISGIGYEPHGTISQKSRPISPNEKLLTLFEIGALCNDSSIKIKDGKKIVEGDPTEASLIVSAAKAGTSKTGLESKYPRIDTLSFESERQFMATLHSGGDKNILFLKGSAEKIAQLCKDLDAKAVHAAAELATEGLRVLAFAKKELPLDIDKITDEILGGAEFAGLQAMSDPPREDAKNAIEACKKAGIAVKMITGDHVVTAKSIATKLGICDKDAKAISGLELETMSENELLKAVDSINVYARVAPDQKLRLVEALQQNGHIVAMTGDGVNDAPALKRADIGVAMGKNGTDTAREASDMVLADDNFASIVSAIEEGRNMYNKLIKFIVWTLPTNIGEGMVILFAILVGVTLPILPVQVLWINMTTAVLLGLMLVFEPKEKGIMQEPPKAKNVGLISTQMLIRMIIVGIIMLSAAFSLFEYELSRGKTTEYARTVAVSAFVAIEIFYLFNCRSLNENVFKMNFFSNRYLLLGVALMIILQMIFIYTKFMNSVFSTEPLEADSLLYILLVGIGSLLLIELEKRFTIAGRF